MEDPQDQLDRQQESERKLYIRIPNEILEDEQLTAADKLVYGRGYSFRRFYESSEATGKALGLCPNQVKISKRKLEKLGYFEMYENTGRGKKYIVREPYIRGSENDLHQGRGSKSDRQTNKKESSQGQNLTPEIKVRQKGDESSLKDKSFKEAQAPESNDEQLNEEPEEPVRYGKAEINEMLDYWQEQTGFSHHGTKAERYAINNLLRKNGYEATKALIRRVGTARRSDDQFAPQIAKPSQLQGKYSKLEALTMWEERQAKQTAAESAKPEGPRFDLLYPQFRPDENDWLSSRDTPEAKAERQATAKRLREKYGFRRASSDNSEQVED